MLTFEYILHNVFLLTSNGYVLARFITWCPRKGHTYLNKDLLKDVWSFSGHQALHLKLNDQKL